MSETNKNTSPFDTGIPKVLNNINKELLKRQTAQAVAQTETKRAEGLSRPTNAATGNAVRQLQAANNIPVKTPTPSPTPSNGTKYVSTNGELLEYLQKEADAYKAETAEERKKREKREKWKSVLAGIGDVGSAIANLVYTTKGAPNAFNPKESMSAKAQERFERERKLREKNRDAHMNVLAKIAALKAADRDAQYKWDMAERERAAKDRELAEDGARWRAELALKESKAKLDEELADLRAEYLQGKISEQEFKTKSAQSKAEWADALNKSIVGKNNRSGTGSGGGRKSGAQPHYTLTNPHTGEVHSFWNRDSFIQAAAAWGYDTKPPKSTSSTDRNITGMHSDSETHKGEDVAAHIGRQEEEVRKKWADKGEENKKEETPKQETPKQETKKEAPKKEAPKKQEGKKEAPKKNKPAAAQKKEEGKKKDFAKDLKL